MKLKDDFFKVKAFCKTETGMDFSVTFNPEHAIFKAHFPDNPITPGVCIIQIIKELTEVILERELLLKKAKNIKFLNVINPLENKEVTFSISISSENGIVHKISALVYSENNNFAKLSLSFTA